MREIDLHREREFENSKVADSGVRARQSKYYWATALPQARHEQLVHDAISGGTVLEVGCSSGYSAVHYVEHCCSYVGVDISDAAIAAAADRNLKNAEFLCVDGHRLPFEDGHFDAVIVNSLLHHLDLKQALAEIARVLRPRGILLFREPLGTNPFFQLYRRFTPRARTPDERPFTFADIAMLREHFDLQSTQWFGFCSIGAAFTGSARQRAALTAIDSALSVTPLRYFFWQFSGAAVKRD